LSQQKQTVSFSDKYNSIKQIPAQFNTLPETAKELVLDVLNIMDVGSFGESLANAAAWGVVNKQFQQLDDGSWVEREQRPKLRIVQSKVDVIHCRTNFEGAAQSWIQVFKSGKFKHDLYGDFEINKELMSSMVENFHKYIDRDVMVDYNHASFSDDPDSAKAAGWVRELETRRNDSQVWALIDWTNKAVEYINEGEYRFISPEWTENAKCNKTGKDLGPMLLAVGLVNRPFLAGMKPVQLSEIPLNGGETEMPIPKEVFEVLGIPEDSEEKQLLEAIKDRQSLLSDEIRKLVEPAEGESLVEAVTRKVGELEEAAKKLDAMQKTVEEMKEENAKVVAEKKASEANAFADKIILTDKKALPKQREQIIKMWEKIGEEETKKFFDETPELDHFKVQGAGSEEENIELTEGELAAAKVLGNDPEKLKKFKAEKPQ